MAYHHRTLRALVLAFFLLALIAGPAAADSAPPPPPAGSNPQPGIEQTQVRMMAETVTLKIAAVSAYPHGQAQVSAIFQMRNLGSAEEKMEARFPLNTIYDIGPNQFECSDAGYPPIRDLAVLVNGKSVPIRTETALLDNFKWKKPGDPEKVDVPCWGHFPVTFPPGQDVTIAVTYTTQGGTGKYSPDYRYQPFYYLLQTGAGWKGTIGTADIIVQAPFDLTGDTLMGASPEGYTITNGNELRWHFLNLEPTFQDDIHITVIEPGLWKEIQAARKQAANNPKSATAWANLAYALHKALLLGYPFNEDPTEPNPYGGMLRWDEGGPKLIQECKQAYQNAIQYLPRSGDLRVRYAQFLLADVWSQAGDPDFYTQQTLRAVEQIQEALKINPYHRKAQAMLKYLADAPWGDHPMMDLTQAPPVYYFLTPLPTMTGTPGAGPTETAVLPPTEIPSPSNTPAPAVAAAQTDTATPTRTAVVVAAVNATPTIQIDTRYTPVGDHSMGLIFGSAAAGVVVLIMLAVIYLRKR